MIEAILLVGLVALFVAYRRLVGRLAELEQRVEMQGAWPLMASEQEAELPTQRSTVVVRHAPAQAVSEIASEAAEREQAPVDSAAFEVDEESPTFIVRESFAAGFERLVGGRLLIWVGGIALALAGLFLVRYAVEVGLIGPRARMIMASLFGLLLLALGEIARRRSPQDPRIGQALVGAGVLVLYGAAYGSHILYGLIGLGTAFAAMAAVAGAALFLSLRHGVPVAALGLVGGFLTPLLVGDPDSGALPLLLYLGVLNIALFTITLRTKRALLASIGRLLTLLWTGSLLLSSPVDALTTGLFILLYTVLACFALRESDDPYPSSASGLALFELVYVVALTGHDAASWALFLALATSGFALGERYHGLRKVPAWGVLMALLLLLSHHLNATPETTLGLIATLVTLLFASGACLRLGLGGFRWPWVWIFCAAVAGPALLVRTIESELLSLPGWGVLFAMLGLAPAVLVWRLRDRARTDGPFDPSLLLAAVTTAILLGVAAFDLVATLWLPIAWLLLALGVLAAARRIVDGGLARLSLVIAGLGALAVAAHAPRLWQVLLASLAGAPALVAGLVPPGEAMLLFAAPGLLLFTLWRWMPEHEVEIARIAGWAAAVFGLVAGYILFKQVFALKNEADFVARGFAERTLLTQALFFAGWLLLKRPRLTWLGGVAFALTMIAAARFAWFDLLVLNPVAVAQDVGAAPLINLLAPAYLGSAFWLFEARRRAGEGAQRSVFLALFLIAIVVGAGLLVRQLFHGAILTGGNMPRAEFYGYSLAGLLLSVGLLLFGWKRGDTPLRVAGLAILAATVVKVFLVDAAALAGVLRILSFLGLGIALIGMGKLYGTLLGRGASDAPVDGLPADHRAGTVPRTVPKTAR